MTRFGPAIDKSIGSTEDTTMFGLDERFDDRWSRIHRTLEAILQKNWTPDFRRTWNDRFSDVYDVTTNFPQEFVERLYENFRDVILDHVHQVYSVLNTVRDRKLLEVYLIHWDNFFDALTYINKLAMHLNSAVVRPSKINDSEFPMIHLGINLPDYSDDRVEIMELGCRMWTQGVIKPLQSDLTKTLLQMIEGDRRERDLQYSETMRRVVTSLVALDEFKGRSALKTYREVFETPYIQATGEHYRMQALCLMNALACTQYVSKVLTRLKEEEFRAHRLCHPSSLEKVKSEVQARMVNDHLQFILSEARTVIEDRPPEDLINMYEALRPSPEGISTLRQFFTSFVEEKAREVVGNNVQLEPQDLVENLDKILSRFEDVVDKVFSGDPIFRKAIEDAIRIVINQQSGILSNVFSSAELIARYCDSLLRKSARNTMEVEEKLEGAIKIFRFLDDKDVFQKFYSRMMAKRLINKQYITSDIETSVINKLRDACGCDYTGKLMRMQRDMHASVAMMEDFAERCPLPAFRNKCELFINILTSGVWPVPNFDIPMNLPGVLLPVVESFSAYFAEKFSGRRLTWIFQLGSVDVKLNFVKRPAIATMNVQQLAICLAFSELDTISVMQLKDITGMPDDYLDVNIDCLTQQGIIRRYQDMEAGASLMLNLDYAPKKPRIKIPVPQTKEMPQQEREETERSTGDMRQVFLQAAICRIMKARATMPHQNLIDEVREASQSRFAANTMMVKKAIDTLLEKEYIRRSPTAQEVYEYIV